MGCCEKKKPETYSIKEKTEALNPPDTSNFNDNEDTNMVEKDNEEIDQTLTVKVSFNDFQALKLLGRGSFGEVLLVRLKATGRIYAMKILDKKILKLKKQQSHTKTERDLMVKINSPFIVNIKSVHDSQIVIFGNEKTKFYILELVLALEFLHKNNMVYRDLKPENILLDSKGHVKLTDFGLSKILEDEDDKAFTLCGTPQYLAPEVLLRQGYDKMVDWWSLGCVMYEMLVGRLPFAIKRGMKLSMKIYEKKLNFLKILTKMLEISSKNYW